MRRSLSAMRSRWWISLVAAALVAAACGDSTVEAEPPGEARQILAGRLTALNGQVDNWRMAATIDEARAAAEGAANLVTGEKGPGYGDRDGDGDVAGASVEGLLPGLAGSDGLVLSAFREGAPTCVDRDVLGGSWDDPAARWAELDAAFAAWRPDNNTYPTLDSHLLRVVGWARLTLATDSLDEAREYAGHARLHVRISRDAITDC